VGRRRTKDRLREPEKRRKHLGKRRIPPLISVVGNHDAKPGGGEGSRGISEGGMADWRTSSIFGKRKRNRSTDLKEKAKKKRQSEKGKNTQNRPT